MQPEFLKIVAMLCGRILTYPCCFHEKKSKVWLVSYLVRESDSRYNVLSTFNNFFMQRTLGIGTILLDIAGTQNSVHTFFFFFEVFLIGSQHIKRLREESKYFEDLLLSDTATLRYKD